MIQTTATLKVGQKGWDFGTRVPTATLVANGVDCVLRYVSTSSDWKGTPIYTWKSLRPEEVAEMHRLSIGVIALWEAGGTDPLQGTLKGLAHGAQAIRSCSALGYPHGLPIIPAVDYDVTPANTNASAQYMQGFHHALAVDGRWATGVYGDTDIIKRCAAEGTASIFHMAGAMAWSNRKVIDLVHLLQSISGSTPSWDNNYVLRDVDMWLPHEVPDIPPDVPIPPAPPVKEDFDTMIYSPAAAYDSRNLGAGGPLYVRVEGLPGSRTIKVAPGNNRAQVVITPLAVSGRGHLRWSGNGVEPDFSEAQFWTGYPPMPLMGIVDLNGDGALDVWIEGETGAACDVIISRTHVNS